MTALLIIASTVVIWGVVAPIIIWSESKPKHWDDRLWEVAGVAGVLSAGAATYVLERKEISWWPAAFVAACIAMVILVINLRGRQSAEMYIASGLTGTFGYLAWPLLTMTSTVKPDSEMTIPWGGIVVLAILVGGTYYYRKG